MWLDYDKVTRFYKLLFLVSFLAMVSSSLSYAQEPYQYLVRRFETPELGISNPTGLLYSPGANALLVTEPSRNDRFVFVSFEPDRTDSVSVTTALADPAVATFDSRFNRLLFWDESTQELVEIRADQRGRPRPKCFARTRNRRIRA
jgi:hypothetical protein